MNSDSKERPASRLPQDSLPFQVAKESSDSLASMPFPPSYLDEMRALRERSLQLRADSMRLRLESRHQLAELRMLRQLSVPLTEPELALEETASPADDAE